MGVKFLAGITPSAIQGQHAAPLLLVQHEMDLKVDTSTRKDILNKC